MKLLQIAILLQMFDFALQDFSTKLMKVKRLLSVSAQLLCLCPCNWVSK